MMPQWTHSLTASLFAFYAALGTMILRRAVTPSCRECLLRHACPNRPEKGPAPCVSRQFSL
jgi:hypothetical protein